MQKNSMMIIIVTLIIVGAGLFYIKQYSSSQPKNSGNENESPYDEISELKEDNYYLFVGATCPHCKTVEEFIDKNNVKDKLNIKIVEVTQNIDNQPFYEEAKKNCNKPDITGVPVLYHQDECIIGDTPAIEKLKEAGGIEIENTQIEKTKEKAEEETE